MMNKHSQMPEMRQASLSSTSVVFGAVLTLRHGATQPKTPPLAEYEHAKDNPKCSSEEKMRPDQPFNPQTGDEGWFMQCDARRRLLEPAYLPGNAGYGRTLGDEGSLQRPIPRCIAPFNQRGPGFFSIVFTDRHHGQLRRCHDMQVSNFK